MKKLIKCAMSLLFNLKKKANQQDISLDYFTANQQELLSRFGREEIKGMLTGIKPNQQLHFIARMINLHDLLAELIKLTGPAHMKLITYSVTEFPLRILAQLREKQIITGLDMVIDFTVSRTPPLKQFSEELADRIKFIDVHSKIMLLSNEQWKLTVLTSANMTRNNRWENGVIFAAADIFSLYDNWFEKLISEKNG